MCCQADSTTNTTLKLGHRYELSQSSLTPVNENDQTEHLATQLEAALRRRSGQNAALSRALCDVFRWRALASLALHVVGESLLLLTAFLLRYIIGFAGRVYAGEDAVVGRGIGLVLGVVSLGVVSSIMISHATYISVQIGVLSRAACVSLIFKKSMTISSKARCRGGYDDGAIMVLAGRDAERLYITARPIFTSFGKFVSVITCIALLTVNLGYSALAGFALLVLIKPVCELESEEAAC